MELRIGYAEAEALIADGVGKRIGLKYVSDDEVEVSTKVKVLFVEKTVGVNIKVVRVDGYDVICSYSGGFGVATLIKSALAFLKGYFSEVVKMVDLNDDGLLVLHLNEVKQLEKVFEMLVFQLVSFSSDTINLSASLK